MSDLPEYQRRIAHEGGSASPNVGAAVADFGKTIIPKQNVVTDIVGKIGSQVAQSASNEQARLAGIEAAKTPGRTLLPTIGESDAEFVKAYRHETKQNAVFESNKLLNKLGNTALKNPTGKSLSEYKMYAEKGIGEILQSVDESDRPDLQRDLMTAYEGNVQKITNAVEKRNAQVMESNRTAQSMQRNQNIQNFGLDGNIAGAQAEYQNGLASIAQGEELFKNGYEFGIPPHEAQSQRMKLKDTFMMSVAQGEAAKAAKEGNSEEFLRDLRENRPEGMSATEHERVVSGTQDYLNHYNSALKGSQNMAFTDAKMELLETGTINVEKYKNQVSPKQLQELDLMMIEKNLKSSQQAITSGYIYENKDNPMMMSSVSDKEMNELYQSAINPNAPLRDKATWASQFQRPIGAFQNQVESFMKSNNPENIGEAAKVIRMLNNNNPIALDGVSAKVLSAARQYTDGIEGGMLEADVLPLVAESLRPIHDKEYSQRVENLSNEKKKLGLDKPVQAWTRISKACNIGSGYMNAGIVYSFNQNFDNYYMQTGDPVESKNLAAMAINKAGGETEFNGFMQWMPAPPEKRYNVGGKGVAWVKKDFIKQTLSLCEQSRKAFDEGAASEYYELEKSKVLDDPQYEPYLSNQKIKIARIDATGKKKEGYLMMQGDNATGLPEEGQEPSYGIYMSIDGNVTSIPIPGTRTGARFTPNVAERTKKFIDERNVIAKKQQAIRKKIASQEFEPGPDF